MTDRKPQIAFAPCAMCRGTGRLRCYYGAHLACDNCGGTGRTSEADLDEPACVYCGAMWHDCELRNNGGSFECEGCFKGRDDGPCFDDLPLITVEVE